MNHAWATKNVLLACVFYRALNHHNREHIEIIFKLRAKHLLVAALKKFFTNALPKTRWPVVVALVEPQKMFVLLSRGC